MNTGFISGRWAPAILGLCAAWLSPSAMAQADEARAKKIVGGVCFVCHGAEGESSSEVFPRLAGQHWEYTAKQLENFKSGKRKSTAMADMVAKLTPDEMIALSKFFEKKSVEAKISEAEKAAKEFIAKQLPFDMAYAVAEAGKAVFFGGGGSHGA